MKRVKFEVAKALKEAGYPQTPGLCYYIGVDEFRPMEISSRAYNYNEHISAPYVMEAWLWLWREKKRVIEPTHCGEGWIVPMFGVVGFYNDPEEAIIAAIEYLVENNLIK